MRRLDRRRLSLLLLAAITRYASTLPFLSLCTVIALSFTNDVCVCFGTQTEVLALKRERDQLATALREFETGSVSGPGGALASATQQRLRSVRSTTPFMFVTLVCKGFL